MIRPSDKKIINATFGSHYSKPIAEHLEAKGFKNSKNEPYSRESVKQFVNGDVENIPVEVAIINFTVKTKVSKNRTLKAMASKLRK